MVFVPESVMPLVPIRDLYDNATEVSQIYILRNSTNAIMAIAWP